MGQIYLMHRVVEISQITGSDIHGTDTEAREASINPFEVDQALDGILQRGDIVVAQRVDAEEWKQERRRQTWPEETWRAKQRDAEGASVIEQGMRYGIVDFDQRNVRYRKWTQRGRADGLPKLSQPVDTLFRWVASNQGGVDRPDRHPGDPIRMEISLGESLIDAC